jgi:hypothetical protein
MPTLGVNSPLIDLLRIDQWSPLQGLVRTPSHPEQSVAEFCKQKCGPQSFLIGQIGGAAYGFLISERETISPSTDRATRVLP